ncbi:dynein regulatory complex protein 1 isoform 1-T1 [Odontesthes bonariensis]|uniref:dynein regulatory complex protein 1 n=1 Tax=Odontesthes bonariensis TaxID=219752 RepID=UPI003F58CCE0
MSDAEKDPSKAQESSELSENQEDENGVSTQNDEDKEESKTREEEEEEEGQKRMLNLQRDLTALVTNIQTAADANIVLQRTQLDEAQRIRQERLEIDAKSSQEQFEEISEGWSIVNQKVILQDLQKALNSQQQLCTALIQDKKKLINDLQQELKLGDEKYVKNLRKNAEEIDLMIERMEDQIKILTKAYREELAQTERVHQLEIKILLTKDITEWEEQMKELWDIEHERLMERRKKVNDYEEEIHKMMLENTNNYTIIGKSKMQESQAHERKCQHNKGDSVLTMLKRAKQKGQQEVLMAKMASIRSRILSVERGINKMKNVYARQEKEFTRQSRILSEDYKRHIQKYERLQMEIKHFANADARLFEDMWLMNEAEVKQLVERALAIDSVICKQHFGLAWVRPHIPFFDLTGPIQPQKLAPSLSQPLFQTRNNSQGMLEASAGRSLDADTESPNTEMSKEGGAVLSESSPECAAEHLSKEMQKKVMELLCDEADFLMEDKVLKRLDSLEKEEQIAVKLGSLFTSLGIDDKDAPKLADFLLKYEQRKREQTEDSCAEPSGLAEAVETSTVTDLTPELVHPDHVLPALQSFLMHCRRSRESSAHLHSSYWRVQGRDASEDEAYWASLGNVISEDKVQLWDIAERTLKQYHAVLTEICDLLPEIEHLKQQNTEQRMKLQLRLTSMVD